ncbi:MAG: hypothetical protein WBI04_11860 [Trichlorobacter sp.]|jgi:hypothetical protein
MKTVTRRSTIARWVVGLSLLTWAGFMLACVPPPQEPPPPPKHLPSSSWGDRYSYRYDPPAQKKAASVPATIIVVDPYYKEADSTLANPTYSKVAKGFASSMGVDTDKVLIAKGMTSKGPFATVDEITYSDKKVSDLAIVPKVFLTADSRYITKWQVEGNYLYDEQIVDVMSREFEMKIGGWVSFVMQEPLSGQKMWIKRLELPETVVKGIEYFRAIPQYETRVNYDPGFLFVPPTKNEYKVLVGHNPGEILYDGKKEALADAIKQMYPEIMGKLWTYVDTDEIISLKEKVKEIRDLKRF